jgi:hypothetical protein
MFPYGLPRPLHVCQNRLAKVPAEQFLSNMVDGSQHARSVLKSLETPKPGTELQFHALCWIWPLDDLFDHICAWGEVVFPDGCSNPLHIR